MKQPSPRRSRRLRLLLLAMLAAVVLGLVAAGGGFAFAAAQETHDSFCASCHTQPESAFYQRSTTAPPVDLASVHTTYKTLCIDCHSGQGITGRMSAELMGAYNAAKWYTGTAVQPAVIKFAITDEHCLKCHQDVTARNFAPKEAISLPGGIRGGGEREGRNNHWHQFMTRWQAADPAAGNCISCHAGHVTGATAQNGFMVAQNVSATCDACHRAIRRGDD